MPTLNWIGKEAVTNHDKEVPFKLLKKVKTASVGDNSQNLIIHGDNLEALKALMPYYVGQVKCIYIDPPYNTGNEGWIYNDKVNSPKIKQWLGKVVGRQSEDLTRHDKWLCMMYPRMKLLKDLLAEDGAIFVSIDDYENDHLRLLLDEIFDRKNFIASFIWEKIHSTKNDAKYVSDNHEYIVCYAKNLENISINLLPRTEEMNARYQNPDNDSRGPWASGDLVANEERKEGYYEVAGPKGTTFNVPRGKHWVYSKENLLRMISENRIWFGKDGTAFPRLKRFLSEVQQGKKADTIWISDEVGHNQEAKREIKALFNDLEQVPFNTPKPIRLIKRILQLVTDKNSLILDSFAGSGTTGHAVLDLNKEDGGNRKFIMVEMEDKVAKDITAERVKRAIKKYDFKEGFEYCELDKPLFDERGQIEDTCDFRQFATYIYFTETQTNIDPKKIEENYIGELGTIEYYLLYKGKNKNDLNKSFLKRIKKTDNKKVIYADRCLIDDETLAKHNVVFKQIPYEVKVY